MVEELVVGLFASIGRGCMQDSTSQQYDAEDDPKVKREIAHTASCLVCSFTWAIPASMHIRSRNDFLRRVLLDNASSSIWTFFGTRSEKGVVVIFKLSHYYTRLQRTTSKK